MEVCALDLDRVSVVAPLGFRGAARDTSSGESCGNCLQPATHQSHFRDSIAELNRTNAQVFGISVDTFFSLKAFRDQNHLTFPLLSDFNKQVIRDYGVYNEDMIGLHGIAKRAVFVLDKDGIVRHREVLQDARNEPDYEKVYATLEAL